MSIELADSAMIINGQRWPGRTERRNHTPAMQVDMSPEGCMAEAAAR
jgi:hypothetical protein